MMDDPYEDARVGAHLREHRTYLGVEREEMIGERPRTDWAALRFVERAQRPASHLVEAHHAALMAAYVGAPGARPVPLARREQWYATPADKALWDRVMEDNPRVSWWWGVTRNTASRGAFCYLCNTLIHGYDVGRGLTARARYAVMDHRLRHITNTIAATAAPRENSNT